MAKHKPEKPDADPPPAPAGPRSAVVTLPGRAADAVEVPADAADPVAAAVAAYKARHGLWALPEAPEVAFPE